MRHFLFVLLFSLPLLSNSQGQNNISQVRNYRLFDLYEVSADQEGMFYSPSLSRHGLVSGSISINEKRLALAEKNGNPRVIGTTTFNLGQIFLEEGDASNAQKYFERSRQAYKKAGDKEGEAIALLHLGFLNYRELNYEQAIRQYSDAASLLATANADGAAVYSYVLTGQAFLAAKEFDKAYSWFFKAYTQLKLPAQKARIGVQLTELSIRKHNYTQAAKYLDEAMALFVKAGDKNGQALVYRDRGILHMKRSDYEAAVNAFYKSQALSPQLSTSKLIKEAYLKIFTVASLKGNHDKSNDVNIIYVQLRDSIDQVEKGRVVSSQLMRREIVEKEAIQEMLRREKDVAYSQLSQQELERNRELTELELERLEKEKIIEDLNAAKHLSDQANIERDEQIRLLTQQKAQQDLALSKKELEISRQGTLRNTLIIGFISLVVVAALLYNRYRNQKKSHLELDKAYSELSQTHTRLLEAQEQLVHAQKMASLGELTAGIAHEIQNPLNFVNNFSDLSLELLKELKDNGADKEAILNDLSVNLEKIQRHGKRADKIVKGMLLHSRSGNAEKQPVNLNFAIDELLDLSYHGSRTRDTGFTADIIRDLDPALPEVMVVSNDISRVLVNIFNNSFYALHEKTKKEGPEYKPSLKVSTKLVDSMAVITIRDNGTGIPDAVVKKIFDPFFTTKPAGQGTGLGLSLSFDIIVKGHGGALKVDSKEGAYTEFVIQLPVSPTQ